MKHETPLIRVASAPKMQLKVFVEEIKEFLVIVTILFRLAF